MLTDPPTPDVRTSVDKRGKRYLVLGAQGLTLSALVIGTVAFVGADKTVNLSVDGNEQQVRTFGHHVSDVLTAAHVQVDGHDALSRPLDAAVSDGDAIQVRLAHPVTVLVDGRSRTVETSAQTVGQLADQLGIDSHAKLNLDADVQLAAATTDLSVTTPKSVSVDLAGKRTTVDTTALDVDELLGDLGVSPDSDDTVSPAGNTVLKDGLKVSYTDVQHRTEKKTATLKHTVKKVEDDKLAVGKTETTTDGKDGKRTTQFDVVYRNGKEISRKQTSSKITTEAVTEVVRVGTKDEAAEKAKAAKEKADKAEEKAAKDSDSSAPKASGSVSGVWQKLAQCESGGNWATNTGNGYYGGLQFTASTWAAQGGTKYAPLPHQATAAQQVAIASKLQAKAGWGQWPACTAKLGLR